MKSKSYKNWSILGCILMGASSIAAAVITESSRRESSRNEFYGTLTASTLGLDHALTCTRVDIQAVDLCTVSTILNGSETTNVETISDNSTVLNNTTF